MKPLRGTILLLAVASIAVLVFFRALKNDTLVSTAQNSLPHSTFEAYPMSNSESWNVDAVYDPMAEINEKFDTYFKSNKKEAKNVLNYNPNFSEENRKFNPHPTTITDGDYKLVFDYRSDDVHVAWSEVGSNKPEQFRIYHKDSLIYNTADGDEKNFFTYVSNAYKLSHRGASFYLIETHTLGAIGFGCSGKYIPVILSKKNWKIGNVLSQDGCGVKEGNIFIKNDALYVAIPHVEWDPSGGISSLDFYQLNPDTGDLTLVNSEFQDFYKLFLPIREFEFLKSEAQKW